MIVFEAVTVAYAGERALRDASFTVPEGELVLVVGPTGSGKTSLLQCLGGHWATDTSAAASAAAGTAPGTEVHQTGRVLVDGVDLRDRSAAARCAVVGMVRQDPAAGLSDGTVESVISARVRPRADDPHAGQRQVEETLDLLGLAELRTRAVTDLSGGQQQRVAIGAALAAGPRVLVLDEPTSALDPVAAEEVLAILHRLVHDVGITVVVAEHRLERVVHHADSVLLVEAGRVTGPLDPATAMARSDLRPPVVELGVRLGWTPLPLSVRAARREARHLRASIDATTEKSAEKGGLGVEGEARVDVHALSMVLGQVVALRTVTLQVGAGEVVALMGRNGAGKSSLLGALHGTLTPTSGRAVVSGRCALAPQDPSDLLTDTTVDNQVSANDTAFALSAGSTSAVLEGLAPGLARDRRPADLSEGQKVCVALSLVLARGCDVVLLDEPTRGLDYPTKARLTTLLTELAGAGRTAIVATHDVELAAEVATRVVILAEGEVVADGPVRRILGDSPAFAPQVAKVMHPLPLLRVSDVVA